MKNPKTLQEAIVFFANPNNCHKYLVARRWPNGVICPTCGRDDVSFLEKQNKWQCKSAHKQRQFSLKTGTIFEDSALDLGKWLTAVWMITNCKNGVSSYEVHRAIGVTQKTAWFMIHRIRTAMQIDETDQLTGTVEADETFVGGSAQNMHRKARERRGLGRQAKKHHTGVIGMMSRKGRVRARVINTRTRDELIPIIREHIADGTELYTDNHAAYDFLDEWYNHEWINHSICEYVRGNAHTNSIENFWSIFKRCIKGTYISVDAVHLQRYVEEQVFRYNERHGNDSERFEKITSQLAGKRLTYADLTGKTPAARFLSR
jgi:hypothetical protein